jgi:chromosome segregation ATPase
MTTDTPRTDAARERYFDGKTSDWVHYTICGMIERELNASKAEVARLNNTLGNTRMSRATIIEDRNLLDQELTASQAEVERLDHLLADASETNHKLATEVDRLTGLLTK